MTILLSQYISCLIHRGIPSRLDLLCIIIDYISDFESRNGNGDALYGVRFQLFSVIGPRFPHFNTFTSLYIFLFFAFTESMAGTCPHESYDTKIVHTDRLYDTSLFTLDQIPHFYFTVISKMYSIQSLLNRKSLPKRTQSSIAYLELIPFRLRLAEAFRCERFSGLLDA